MIEIAARILCDSLAPCGKRLVSWELTYPRRPVHDELLTHRAFSRNAASSRAIPTEKFLEQVRMEPAMPQWVGANKAGMQAEVEMSYEEQLEFRCDILDLRDAAVAFAEKWNKRAHKQHVNRYLEPWQWYKVIVSATEFDNWFAQRCSLKAQPEIRQLAEVMYAEYHSHQPTPVEYLGWHLPLIQPDEFADNTIETLVRVAVARCARVSYLTHDGKRDISKDLELYTHLLTSGHWSPFEHVAQARYAQTHSGNFIGWTQYRKRFPNENVEVFTKA